MRKLKLAALTAVIAAFVPCFAACGTNDGSDKPVADKPLTSYSVTVNDLTLQKGETKKIDYKLLPAGKLSVIELEIVSASPSGCVKIDGDSIEAVRGGDAIIRAVVTNTEGAAVKFTAVETFNVSIAKESVAAVTDLAVCGVKTYADGNDTVCELEYADYNRLLAQKANCRSLVTGTLGNGSSFKSVTFDETADKVSVVIAAEDGKTQKTFDIRVLHYIQSDPVQLEIANAYFEGIDEGYNLLDWKLENIKSTCTSTAGDTSNKKNNPMNGDGTENTRGFMGWGNILEEGTPARIYQTVGKKVVDGEETSFEVGDYVTVSVWISTRYGTSVTSIKLFAGEQYVEMSETDPDWQYKKLSREFKLTAADIKDGKIDFGVQFTQAKGGWCNIDDFALTYAERLYYRA